MTKEHLTKTDNDMIFIERDVPLSREEVDQKIAHVTKSMHQANPECAAEAIKQALKDVVPTYRDPEEVNQHATASVDDSKYAPRNPGRKCNVI